MIDVVDVVTGKRTVLAVDIDEKWIVVAVDVAEKRTMVVVDVIEVDTMWWFAENAM